MMSEEELRLETVRVSLQILNENNQRREEAHRKNIEAGFPASVFAPKEDAAEDVIKTAKALYNFVKGE
jgi:hypothetical protein